MILAPLLLAAALQGALIDAPAEPLTVVVENVRDARGHVRVELCTSDTFLGDRCQIAGEAEAVKGVTVVTLRAVPSGVYAIQAYHDRNDNHRVDRGALGIPTESVGFSRYPSLSLHAPVFERASFSHTSAAQMIAVKLINFF